MATNIYSDYNIFITKFILSPVKTRKLLINNLCSIVEDQYAKNVLGSTNVYVIDDYPYNIYDNIMKIKELKNEQVHKSFGLWVDKSL